MKQFSRILFYLRNEKSQIALYFICNLLQVLFSLVSLAMLDPFLELLFNPDKLVNTPPPPHFTADTILVYIKYFISAIIRKYDSPLYALGVICAIVILSNLLKNVFYYLTLRIVSPVRNRVMMKFRADLYSKILVLPIGYFTEQRKGDIISRMSNDVNEVEWSIMGTLEGLLREPITLLVILVMLVIISPALSIFLLVLLPATGFIIGRVSRSLKKQSNAAQENMGTLMSILDETLGGIRIVKAFNAEKLFKSRFFQTNETLSHLRNKMNFRRDLASPLSEYLGVIVLSIILWFGGQMALNLPLFGHHFNIAPGTFITYILFFTQVIQPAKSLSTAFYNAQRGTAAIKRIEEVLNTPVVIEDKPAAQTLQEFSHSIEFRNVSFDYDGIEILKNINITVTKGTTVALVGSSGAGKSTLADLVPRFHDVSGGELLLDGVNIKDYTLESVRNQIGIVTQEPILFNDTIASNIALSHPDIGMDAIEQAAKVANAWNFITNKEEGFDTNIGDRGSKLSGGERQRLTIARAVLKNPPILIFDEATSALDTESERLVQESINNVMKNRTSIVIAHRLSTIRHADEIIVIQKGEIAERGTHEELYAHNGIYRRLIEMQEIK